jgi:hypothetical protein
LGMLCVGRVLALIVRCRHVCRRIAALLMGACSNSPCYLRWTVGFRTELPNRLFITCLGTWPLALTLTSAPREFRQEAGTHGMGTDRQIALSFSLFSSLTRFMLKYVDFIMMVSATSVCQFTLCSSERAASRYQCLIGLHSSR